MTDEREPILAAPAVDAELDSMAIAHLDFDAVTTCQAQRVFRVLGDVVERRPKCGQPAEWIAEHVTCGAPTHLCDDCKDRAENRMHTACGSCLEPASPSMWRFIRIGGA